LIQIHVPEKSSGVIRRHGQGFLRYSQRPVPRDVPPRIVRSGMTSISVGAFQGFAWDCFISGSSFLSTILSSRYSKNAVTSWIPLPKYPPAAGRPDGYFRRHRAAFIAGARPRCPSPVPTARAPVARSPVRVRKGGGRQAGGWRIKKPRSQMSSGRSRISDVRAARSTSLPSSSIVYLLSPSAIHYQHDFISFSFSLSLSLSLSLFLPPFHNRNIILHTYI